MHRSAVPTKLRSPRRSRAFFALSAAGALCLAGTTACAVGSRGSLDGGTQAEAGQRDGGASDARIVDARAIDAGPRDAGNADASRPDVGPADASALDTGTPDGGTPDAGMPDAGMPDTGMPDTGMPDAGMPDAGPNGCADGMNFTDLGEPCEFVDDCDSEICAGSLVPICTKTCLVGDDCPNGWSCVGTTQSFRVCMIGARGTGPTSTNSSCTAVTYADDRTACTRSSQCDSGLCLNDGLCSKRCSVDSQCTSPRRCYMEATQAINYCAEF